MKYSIIRTSCVFVVSGLAFVIGLNMDRPGKRPDSAHAQAVGATPTATAVSCAGPAGFRFSAPLKGIARVLPDGSGQIIKIGVPDLHPNCTPYNGGSSTLRAWVDPTAWVDVEVNNHLERIQVGLCRADDPDCIELVDRDCGGSAGYDAIIPRNTRFVRGNVTFACCNNCP